MNSRYNLNTLLLGRPRETRITIEPPSPPPISFAPMEEHYQLNTITTPPKRFKGAVIPVKEYCLLKEINDSGKTFYHLMVNVIQHERIQALQKFLLDTFDSSGNARKLSFEQVDPTSMGIPTLQPNAWYLYTYVKPQSVEEIKDSSSNNLYCRCIYWENGDSFYKNGVSLVGLRSVNDGDYQPVSQRKLTAV